MGPITQGVISNGIWWCIFLVGSAIIAFLTVTHPNYALPSMYGVITFAACSVIFFTMTGRSLITKKPQQLDAKNLEASVKVWIATLGMASEPVTVPDADFAYKVTLPNGTGILVTRTTKWRGEYLRFQIGMAVSPEHRAAIERLTGQQALMVIQELSLELARLGISYSLNFSQGTNQSPSPNQLTAITIGKVFPFAGLTEAAFASQLDEMDSAGTVVRAALALMLHRYAPGATQLGLQ